jgi:alcohol dehydrogenase class IV
MGVVGATNGNDTTTAIVDSVREMRTALGLPDCLSDEIPVERDHLSRLAKNISQDVGVKNGPTGVPSNPDDFQEILETVF